jgi:hypothetical protein
MREETEADKVHVIKSMLFNSVSRIEASKAQAAQNAKYSPLHNLCHFATHSIRTFEVDQTPILLTCLDKLRNIVASI